MYDKLVPKVNRVDISGFVLRTKYDADKSDLGKNIPDTWGLVKKDHNTRITEIENKIPSISGTARNFALTAGENKMPNVSNLV